MAKADLDQQVAKFTPLLAVILLEAANVNQLWRMWSIRSSEGQSIWGWICVNVALILWCNFYRYHKHWIAFYATLFGIFMNSLVIFSVVYFRRFE